MVIIFRVEIMIPWVIYFPLFIVIITFPPNGPIPFDAHIHAQTTNNTKSILAVGAINFLKTKILKNY